MALLNVGIIGTGVIGSYHIDKCRKHPGVAIAGVYDSDSARATAAAQRFSVPAFGDLESLLDKTEAVIVATPATTHADVVRASLAAGRHVLVEKPLAADYNAGAALVALAEKRKRILHVGHSEAFNPAFIKLISLAPRPRFIEIHRLAAFSPRGTDVSVILDLMVHDLHLVWRLCREEPLYEAIAATGVPVVSGDIDIANVRLSFPSGCVANITASRISDKKMRKVRVFQKDNYYSVDLDKKEFAHYSLLPPGSSGPGGLPIAQTREVLSDVDALQAELEAFVAEIHGTTHEIPGTLGAEALPVLKMTDAILHRM
jgi:predicted dehydrogenase